MTKKSLIILYLSSSVLFFVLTCCFQNQEAHTWKFYLSAIIGSSFFSSVLWINRLQSHLIAMSYNRKGTPLKFVAYRFSGSVFIKGGICYVSANKFIFKPIRYGTERESLLIIPLEEIETLEEIQLLSKMVLGLRLTTKTGKIEYFLMGKRNKIYSQLKQKT